MTQSKRSRKQDANCTKKGSTQIRRIVGEIVGVKTDTEQFYLKHPALSPPQIGDWVHIRPVTTDLSKLRYLGPNWTRYQNDDGFMEARIVDADRARTPDGIWDKSFVFSP